MEFVIVWILGLVFSCGIGHFAVGWFLNWLRERADLSSKFIPGVPPPWLTGILERGFFTIAVAVDASDALTAMMAWLALKLAANWQARVSWEDNKRILYMFTALLAGFMSMLFAFLGGLFIRNIL